MARRQRTPFSKVRVVRLLAMLNSCVMIRFLEELTGIEKLIPDPHFTGGGLHQIVGGGSLDVHADFRRGLESDQRKLRRAPADPVPPRL
jgi:hypothetical protein